MKKIFLILIIVILICVGIGGYFYYQKITSPEYSLLQIKQSIENHDISTFEKHVDVNGCINRILSDLPNAIIEKSGTQQIGFLPKEAVHLIKNMVQNQVKNAMQQTIHESIRTFVERGHFNRQVTGDGTVSKLIKAVPIESLEVKSLGEVQKEGKICYFPLNIYVEKYDGQVTAKFMMRDKGSYWQVAEVSNLPNLIDQIEELKKTYPYRDLCAASIYIAESMESELYVTQALGKIVKKLAASGYNEKAIELFPRVTTLVRNNIKDWQRDNALRGIVIGLSEVGRTEQAIKIAKEIESDWRQLEAFCAIVSESIKKGDNEKANELLNNHLNINQDTIDKSDIAVAYYHIAKDLMKSRVNRKANYFLTKSLNKAQTLEKVRDKAQAYFAIAVELKKIGDNEKANKLFMEASDIVKNMEDGNLKSEIYFTIGKEFTKSGNTERANEMFTQALNTIRNFSKDSDRAVAFGMIAIQLIDIGYTDKAEKLLTDGLAVAEGIENKLDKARAFSHIAMGLIKIGNKAKAIDIVQKINLEKDPAKIKLTGRIAIELAKSGDTAKAMDIASEIEKEIAKANVFSKMAIESTKAGYSGKAIDIANNIKSNWIRAKTLQEIAAEFAKEGNLEEARKLFVKAINNAQLNEEESVIQEIAINLNEVYIETDGRNPKLANAVMTAFSE